MAAVVTARTIVPDLLDGYNYEDWSVYMKNYLMGQHLWDIVEHGIPSTGYLDSPLDKAKNAAALHAIHITCSPATFVKIRSIVSAKAAWNELAMMMRQEQQSTEESSPGIFARIRGIGSACEQLTRRISNTVAIDMSTTISSVEYAQLRRGIWEGNWDVVTQFLEKYPINTILEEEKKGTVLHLAIRAGQEDIAKKLVGKMSTTDLEIQHYKGATALNMAARKNLISVAECLVQKHPGLLAIASRRGLIPVTRASAYGHREMTRYLYSITPSNLLEGVHGFDLLCYTISNKMFDISLDLLQRSPNLAVNLTKDKVLSPILKLSTKPSAFYSGCTLSFWKRWIYHLIKVKQPNTHQNHSTSEKLGIKGIQNIYDLKLNHYYVQQILCRMCKYISTLNYEQQRNCGIYEAVFEVTKSGTYEFLIELCRALPSMVAILDEENRNVLMVAIRHRQEKIYNHFCGISKTTMVEFITRVDINNNNTLHVAGKLAPTIQLSRISGSALQMQRELQWFKEVEKITPSCYIEAKNDDGLTPQQVFTDSHKELLKEGEKWMKDTATSFIIVGTLIVTIMFAVAFTVPGGNDQTTGFPIFLGEKEFKIFLISDAISFFAASTSILMFLGILTSRYAEDDFLSSLPKKLIIGLSTLFISTTAMMVSFSATLVIMLRGQWWTTIPILVVACIPVTLFVWLQFPLLVRIFMSTYGSGIFGKKVKVHPHNDTYIASRLCYESCNSV